MKNKLRDEFFEKHVSHKTTDGIPVVSTHPHNLFEWFKEKMVEYSNWQYEDKEFDDANIKMVEHFMETNGVGK